MPGQGFGVFLGIREASEGFCLFKGLFALDSVENGLGAGREVAGVCEPFPFLWRLCPPGLDGLRATPSL